MVDILCEWLGCCSCNMVEFLPEGLLYVGMNSQRYYCKFIKTGYCVVKTLCFLSKNVTRNLTWVYCGFWYNRSLPSCINAAHQSIDLVCKQSLCVVRPVSRCNWQWNLWFRGSLATAQHVTATITMSRSELDGHTLGFVQAPQLDH